MRFCEIIVETAEENQIINLVSKAAAKTVAGGVRKKLPDFDSSEDIDYSSVSDAGYNISDMAIPKIESQSVKQTLDNLKIVLRYEPHASNDLDMGGYAPKSHAIILNIPDIKTFAHHKNRNFDDILQQTLAHEIQHAIDKTKSDGRAFQRPANLSSDDYEGYLKLPHEINARFTEALLEISRVFTDRKKHGVEMPTNDLVKLIKQKFDSNRLDKLDSDQLKRLYSRVYKFYQAELTSPKAVEPDDLLTKAKNWILGKKTVGSIK